MCKRFFAYIECPQCKILHRPITAIERCNAAAPAAATTHESSAVTKPKFSHARKFLAAVVHHFQYGPDHHRHLNKLAKHTWHYTACTPTEEMPIGAKMPPVAGVLAYKDDEAFVCDDCLRTMVSAESEDEDSEEERYYQGDKQADGANDADETTEASYYKKGSAEAKLHAIVAARKAKWAGRNTPFKPTPKNANYRLFDLGALPASLGSPETVSTQEFWMRYAMCEWASGASAGRVGTGMEGEEKSE